MANSGESNLSMPRRLAYGCLAAYWLVMFTATHWPSVRFAEQRVTHLDKIFHFSAYAVLMVLLVVAQRARRGDLANGARSWLARWGVLFITVAAYAAFDELTQPYFRRDADFYDWVADLAGATIAAIACARWFPPR
ncbi:MAG: VanZ family protein [Planctomycetes bacterium]|nr:VanZ family protein [Planctomycetota bacterium]